MSENTGLITTTEVITPERARKLSDNMDVNRSLSARRVEMLARDMKTGHWTLTGDSIKINQDGMVVDGQHRIFACLQANVPFDTVVVYNAPSDALYDVNIRPRTGGDQLRIRGVPYYNRCAGLARRIASLNLWGTHDLAAARSISTVESIDVYDENAEGIARSVSFMSKLHDKTKSSKVMRNPGSFMALHYFFSTVSPAMADEFMTRLYSGENLEPGHPILHLRNQLVRSAVSTTKLSARATEALTVKAWNAVYNNAEMKQLRWRVDESFPDIAGI
jgi:hypothetical protein